MEVTINWELAAGVIRAIVEIGVLWFVFYRVLAFFEGTRAFQVLTGIVILVGIFIIAQKFGLRTLEWLMTKIFAISVVAVLVIFQPELRRGLARLGQHHIFSFGLKEEEIAQIIREIAQAAENLSKRKIGALIAVERQNVLSTYAEIGVALDGKISAELIQSVFTPPGPLHDGGIIIQGDRIIAAASVFPLSENPNFNKVLGTRHRAAAGLTEQSDAVAIVVSEETGAISLAIDGKLFSMRDKSDLIEALELHLITQKKA